MKKESIEFEPIVEDSDHSLLVRKFFRVPVRSQESVTVLIRQKKYSVSDISQTGIGVCLKENMDFAPGEILEKCELVMTTSSIAGMKGQVVHCSSNAQGLWQCGIKWIDMDLRQKEQMNRLIVEMKARVLEDDGQENL